VIVAPATSSLSLEAVKRIVQGFSSLRPDNRKTETDDASRLAAWNDSKRSCFLCSKPIRTIEEINSRAGDEFADRGRTGQRLAEEKPGTFPRLPRLMVPAVGCTKAPRRRSIYVPRRAGPAERKKTGSQRSGSRQLTPMQMRFRTRTCSSAATPRLEQRGRMPRSFRPARRKLG
jgi:hypothetical protein